MNPFLGEVIEAHGGLSRWKKVDALAADLSIGGELWNLVGRPGIFSQIRAVSSTREQFVQFESADKAFSFRPQAVSVRDVKTAIETSSLSPHSKFAKTANDSPWTDIQAAYFNGYALWQYLNAPFLYAYPAFEVETQSPWDEDGETWNVLKITFPADLVAHTRIQYAYFGEDRLLRRLRYTVDVLGGAGGVNYASEYQDINGIRMPLTRTVYGYDQALRKVDEPVLVRIDIRSPELVKGNTSAIGRSDFLSHDGA